MLFPHFRTAVPLQLFLMIIYVNLEGITNVSFPKFIINASTLEKKKKPESAIHDKDFKCSLDWRFS
jgi:hypothetical protein